MAFGKKVQRSKTAKRNTVDNVASFGPLKSNTYDIKINKAYIHEAPNGSMHFRIEAKPLAGGKFIRISECFQSGDEKGNRIFYTDKDGNDQDMIGYTKLNDLLICALGDEAFDSNDEPMDIFALNEEGDVVKKKIPLYDFKQTKEVPTKVPVIVPLIGKVIKVGLLHVVEDVAAKDSNGRNMYKNNKPVPSGKTREVNEVNFYFDTEGFSANEIIAQADEPESIDTWLDGYAGKVIDRSQGGTGGKSNGGLTRKPMKNTDVFND